MVIKWKNILNRGNKTDRAPAPAACPAEGRLRAAAGLTAFLLGISLLLAGGLGQYGWWSTELGARWARDSLEEDWQDTAAFRTIICNWLDACLTAGTWEYTSGGDYGKELLDGLEGDKNLLYAVARRGSVLYTNTSDGGFLSSGQPPEGYRFALRCEDGMVSITQDGRELDVYGDGWYTEDDLWFVPGYENFPMDADARNIQVYLAAASDPKPMVYGNYLGSGADICTSQLYDLVQNLAQYRRELLTEWGMLGGGVLLLALALVLRRDKTRADRFLARGTGRIWFEVKVLLALLALLLLPWGELSSWSSETPVASYTAASSTASSGSAQWDTGAVALYSYSGDVVQSQAETHVYGTGEGPDVLFDFLQALGTRPAAAVLAFLALYLLVFNDLRYNRQAWRHGVLGMLAARELELPVQKRLSRSAGLVSLSCLLLNCVTAGLLIWCSSWSWGSVRLETAWLLCLPPLLLAAVTAAFLFRQHRLWGDLGALTGQIAAVRAGELARPLELPRDHDLSQAADDLNHIQQGLQAAMEERTRSERMKVELVTNVSHDLKTPLTSIISYAELLEQEHLEPPAGEYVTILSQKAQRLKGMVQDVFEVSKAASGQLPVSLKRLDLARLLRQTLADMDQPIQESGLQLRTQLPDHSVLIQGDSDRLYRVFQNLLGNALKYSLAGSRVYLTLTVEEGQAVAALRNTSAAELRPGLDYTQRFVRGDESRTDGGSGLGLSIASSFVQACGGQFQVETQADLFTALVSFPLDASPSDPR